VHAWRRSPAWGGRATAALALILIAVVTAGCGGGKSSKASTTTIPEALWQGQARAYVAAHGDDLKAISEAAKNLADAAGANNSQLSQVAVSQFLLKVSQAEGDLPTNAFGQDLHKVFVAYVTALSDVRKGISNNDQRVYKQGSDELSAAVAQFGAVTNRIKASP
jgi:hypothetical protein